MKHDTRFKQKALVSTLWTKWESTCIVDSIQSEPYGINVNIILSISTTIYISTFSSSLESRSKFSEG